MAKALFGHVGGPDPRMVSEMRRLQQRVRDLEAELVRLQEENDALAAGGSHEDDVLVLDREPGTRRGRDTAQPQNEPGTPSPASLFVVPGSPDSLPFRAVARDTLLALAAGALRAPFTLMIVDGSLVAQGNFPFRRRSAWFPAASHNWR